MLTYGLDHCYTSRWELVVAAFFRRFPMHPKLPYVLKNETVLEEIDDDAGLEVHEKMVSMDYGAPAWMRRLLGMEVFVFRMRIEIDRTARVMRTVSTNETLTSVFRVLDEAVFSPHPLNGEWTWLVRRCEMDFHSIPGPFHGLVENFALSAYQEKALEAVKLDEELVEEEMGSRVAGG